MSNAKKPDLEVRCDGMTYQMEDVGSWSWQKGENGSITLTASPPGAEPAVAAPAPGRSRGFGKSASASSSAELGKKLVTALSPGLQAKADELKASSRASMAAAKAAAAEKAATEQAAAPTRGAPPEDGPELPTTEAEL